MIFLNLLNFKFFIFFSKLAHSIRIEDASVIFKADLEKINELRFTKKQIEREQQELQKTTGDILEDETLKELNEKKSKFRSEIELLIEKREKLEEQKRSLRLERMNLDEEMNFVSKEIGAIDGDIRVYFFSHPFLLITSSRRTNHTSSHAYRHRHTQTH